VNTAEHRGLLNRPTRLAVALVVLALVAFTSVRTTPLYSGLEPGSSLSTTHTKQRQFRCCDVGFIPPRVVEFGPVAQVCAHLPVSTPASGVLQCFFPRCSDLPPPNFA
jgi:hypothetical protein